MERISLQIARIREYLTIIEELAPDCRQRFNADKIYRGALLHYLYRLADSCIVLAELVIKKKRLRTPQTYAEAFDILGENRVLAAEFAYRFAAIAGFRNFLSHDYERIDQEIICGQIIDSLTEIQSFLQQIEQNLAQ